MTVPKPIKDMTEAAHLSGTFPLTFANPRGGPGGRQQITRNFVVYLELGMQAKHDTKIRSECLRIGVTPRDTAGEQFTHAQGTTAAALLGQNGFYEERSRVAASVVKDKMIALWALQPPNGKVFEDHTSTTGNTANSYHRKDVGGQNVERSDGNCYEISFWYEGLTIYVLYHCYPPRL